MTKGVTPIDDNSNMKETTKGKTMFEVNAEVVVNGQWMKIDEIDSDGTAWAIDQDGQGHEITEGMVDHYYSKN